MTMDEAQPARRRDLRMVGGLTPRRIAILVVVAFIHVAAVFGLLRAFDVDIVPDSVESIIAFAVPAETPEPDPPPPPPPPPQQQTSEPEGASGAPAPKAKPKEITAPPARIPPPEPRPAPRASSDGTENRSGAVSAGAGTGGGGPGNGTGSGGSGSGMGGVIATRPSVRSGNLNTASDFSVPPGGRESRVGNSVTVQFTVGVDGRARNCSVLRSSVDAQTAAEACPLVIRKIRFNPATDRAGNPVEAVYGYRVDFKPA